MNEAPKQIWAAPRIGPGWRVMGWDQGKWHATKTELAQRTHGHALEYTRTDLVPDWQPIETAPENMRILVMPDEGEAEPIIATVGCGVWREDDGTPMEFIPHTLAASPGPASRVSHDP